MEHITTNNPSKGRRRVAVDSRGFIISKTEFLELIPTNGSAVFKFRDPKEIPSIKASICKWNKQVGKTKGMFITYSINKIACEVHVKDVGGDGYEVINPQVPGDSGPKRKKKQKRVFTPSKAKPRFKVELNGVEYEADDTPVSTQEVAEYLHISVNAVHCMCKRGIMPYTKMGRKNVYSLKIVHAIMFNSSAETSTCIL